MDFFGPPNFERMAAEHDHEKLYRLLEHRDKLIRLQAAQTLADMNDGAGWRFIMDAVRQSGDVESQIIASTMLGELGHPRGVLVLAEVINKARYEATSSDLISAAREALEMIGGPEADEVLQNNGFRGDKSETGRTTGFDAQDMYVRPVLPRTDQIRLLSAEEHLNNAVQLREAEVAERGLVETSLALWLSPHWANAWYLRGVLMEDLDRTFEATLAYQHVLSIDPTHSEAREALAELEEEENLLPLDTPTLLTSLGDRDWKARRDAAAGLGDLAQKNLAAPDLVIDALIGRLDDEDREVRHAVVEALRHFDDRRAVLPLLALRESSWLARFSILQSLAYLGALDGLVTVLRREMNQIQERNPVFSSHKDPLLEVEYELLMEIGVRALEQTGDVEGLLLLAEGNAWEEIEDDEVTEDYDQGYATDEIIPASFDGVLSQSDGDADQEVEGNLESFVDEVAQMAAAALERLVNHRLKDLTADLLRRISEVPDLTLYDLTEENPDPVVVYDLSGLRQAAKQELTQRTS